mmetsp:Transcript_9769/g.22652  ORF Transcript_9769/g.22652 Transcript_9769/m.22652 type:complete len:284 (-) Transcript_9769:31-882(-)
MRGREAGEREKRCMSFSSVWRTTANEHEMLCCAARSSHSWGISDLVVKSTARSGRSVEAKKVCSLEESRSMACCCCTSLSACTWASRLRFSSPSTLVFSSSSLRSFSTSSFTAASPSLACWISNCSSFLTASTCPTWPSFVRAASAIANDVFSCSCMSSAFNPLASRCNTSTCFFSSTTTGPPSAMSLRNSRILSKSFGPSYSTFCFELSRLTRIATTFGNASSVIPNCCMSATCSNLTSPNCILPPKLAATLVHRAGVSLFFVNSTALVGFSPLAKNSSALS